MSHSQRKRHLEHLRSLAKEARHASKAAKVAAQQVEGLRITNDDSDSDELIIVDEPVLPTAAEIVLPFLIDNSHAIVVCHGYAACTRCAAMGCTGTKRNQALQLPCLGPRAKHAYSEKRLERLLDGQHPRPDRAKGFWPDGQKVGLPSPPTRIRVLQPNHSDRTTVCQVAA